MQNVIHLLPDALANQIAAGEVVQRPASVVKELLENAVDAGATRIDLLIKDAGRTLIQVSDNGSGMSVQDARMAFERHATSKIRSQEDLFRILTMGFRGEALASIAAVAQVKLRTRLRGEEIGVEIDIEGSEFRQQQPCVCPVGSTFQVKNLFYNVPARRNFLKSNPVEARHIIGEFIRVAIPHPDLHLTLTHSDTLVYDLPAGTTEARLAALFGDDLRGNLSEIDEATGYVHITGYIADPSVSRKSRGEQFFFVNRRFIRSPYLHHALMGSFEEFLPKDSYPFYCLFLEIDPQHVDINIHPTKTEVKFDDERTIYVLLQSAVKRVLGMMHQVPGAGNTPLQRAIYRSQPPAQEGDTVGTQPRSQLPLSQTRRVDWEALYSPPAVPRDNAPRTVNRTPALFPATTGGGVAGVSEDTFFVQMDGRYILTQRGGRLYIIDQHLAHQRVLFERFLRAGTGKALACQQLLFPQTLTFSAGDYELVRAVDEALAHLGFEVKEFGPQTFIVYGTPAGIATSRVRDIFDQLLDGLRETGDSPARALLTEQIARAIALRNAVTSPQKLNIIEMKQIVEDLFACDAPAFAPNKKPVYKVISSAELEVFFR
ncbi:MAG: DNA mismatch repair endonuclease MutL [Bacteroidia bacterium]